MYEHDNTQDQQDETVCTGMRSTRHKTVDLIGAGATAREGVGALQQAKKSIR